MTTSRTPGGTPKQLISSLRERTPKIETAEKNRNQKEKYFYLNESARPLHDLTSKNFSFEIFSSHLISLIFIQNSGRMPPDPLKEKDTNVEDMARFVLEFKDLITAECFEKIDAENQERERVKTIGKIFRNDSYRLPFRDFLNFFLVIIISSRANDGRRSFSFSYVIR